MKSSLPGYAGNDVVPSNEEPAQDRRFVESAEFMKMLRLTFAGKTPGHVYAVLKRCVLFIFGKKAMYLRLPGRDQNCIVHRIIDDLHDCNGDLDVLAEHDKSFYQKYKDNELELPEEFEENVLLVIDT